MISPKRPEENLVCEEWFVLSLKEVTLSFGVSSETITEIVEEGIVTAETDPHNELQFNSEALRRIRIVLSLQRDLGINLAGAGLALDLMHEIERLHALID